MPTVTPTLAFDSYASDNNFFNDNGAELWLGSNSAVTNAQIAILLKGVAVEQGVKITDVPVSLTRLASFAGDSLDFVIGAQKIANASAPNSSTNQRGRTMTTARTVATIGTNTGTGTSSYNAAPAVQEIVNLSDWKPGNDILLLIRSTGGIGGGAGNGGRRMRFGSLQSDKPPKVTISYALPGVTAQMASKTTTVSRTMMTAGVEEADPPPTIVAQLSSVTTTVSRTMMTAARGDPNKNTPQRVERLRSESHAFITEDGETLPFAANFDETIGGVRTEMLGSVDEVWYPAVKRLMRTPEALTFRAYLPERSDPQRDGDRFVRLLASVRQLVLPNGQVWQLHNAQETARPTAATVDLVARPKTARPEHPLLSGVIGAAFETYGSTPELPIYAVDPAGGITAPVAASSWDNGALAFAVRINERTRQSIVALGTPVATDGNVPDGSLALWWDRSGLVSDLRGEHYRLREQFLGQFGTVLVGVLRWTPRSATLTTASGLGLRTWELPIGAPKPLSEQQVSAGVRADGVGSGSFIAFGRPFLSIRPGTVLEAESAARKLYDALSAPGLSWEIRPPNVSLELFRTDDKSLELAPGESVTFGLGARRVGNYRGPLELTLTTDTLTSSFITRTEGDTDFYTITLTAPAGTSEAAYTFNAEVKIAGVIEEEPYVTDTIPPVVTFIAPANGANYTVGNTVKVSYSLSDNIGVVEHTLIVHGREVTPSGDNPYSYSFRITEGARVIRIEATDAAGNVGIAERTVNGVAAGSTPEPTPTPAATSAYPSATRYPSESQYPKGA